MSIQTLINKIKSDDILNNIASFFDNEIYLVGGAVRDALLGKDSYDRDLLILDEDSKIFAQKVAEFFDAKLISLDEENKIYRVVLSDKVNYLDITNPIENSLDSDLKRRDLTINSIAINISNYEIPQVCIPYIDDLNKKIIREVSENNFVDDPLRLLRVFRFYSILGFSLSESILEIVSKYVDLVNNPAKERVEYELMKLFSGDYAHDALLLMDKVGLLERIFPFVSELKLVPPNEHHHLNLFMHSIETVKQIQKIYEDSVEPVKMHMQMADFGGFSRLAHLKLSGFMHDIGKYSTWMIEEDTGRHRFIKHDSVGAKLCVPILKNLCFSNKQIDYISYIIKRHMYPTAVVSAPEITDKIMMRYLRKSEDRAIDNILIAKADRLSALGPEITEEIVETNIKALDSLLDFCLLNKDCLKPLPKLLNGLEIADILNITPSSLLGKVVELLEEAQISGDVNSKDEAIIFIKNINLDNL